MHNTPRDLKLKCAAKRAADGSLFWRFVRSLASHPQQIVPLARAEYRRRIGIAQERRKQPCTIGPPINVSINLTRRCNLRCEMCIQHRHDRDGASTLSWYDSRRELPVADWVRLLDAIVDFRPTLYVTGGEPMLHAGFEDFIRAAKQRRLFLHLATNGILLERHAALLVDSGVEIVTISLDGTAAIHDRIRGQRGLFDQTVAGIRALVATRRARGRSMPIVGLNFVISQTSLAAIADMVPLAVDLDADFLQFQHTIFSTPDCVARHNRLFSTEFAASRGIQLQAPSIPPGEFYEGGIADEHIPLLISALEGAKLQAKGLIKLSFLPNLSPAMIQPYYRDLEYPFGGRCDTPWKTLRILPDGTVMPCLHVVAGNIREQSIDAIWNGPTMQNYRTLIAEKLLPACARCCNRTFVPA